MITASHGREWLGGQVLIHKVSQDKIKGVLTVSGEIDHLRHMELLFNVTNIKFIKITTYH